MPTARRRRRLGAEPGAVWRIVADPAKLPLWWPRVERVEEASPDAWTTVLTTSSGKAIRADYTRVEADEPHRLVWRHEVAASPFERILDESLTEIELEPTDGGTRIELRARQRLRGSYRFGGFMARRAARRQLGQALAALEQVVEEEP